MAAEVGEEGDDLAGGWDFAGTRLGIDRQGVEGVDGHRVAELALEQGVDGERDEEEKQEGVDAGWALEVDRDDLGNGLELLVTLFDERLVLVDCEDLPRRMGVGRQVGDQGEDAVVGGGGADGRLIDGRDGVPPRAGHAPVGRAPRGLARRGLHVAMVVATDERDVQPGAAQGRRLR